LSRSSQRSSIEQKQLNCWFEGNVPGPRVERRVVGIKHEREIVSSASDPEGLLIVSRFDPKILAQIDDVIACVPEILDGNGVREAYKKLSIKRPSDLKTLIWRDAVEELLVLSIKKKIISQNDADLIRAGLDSVLVILDTVLWSAPLSSSTKAPSNAEEGAFADVLEAQRVRSSQNVFMRYYGDFEGYRVVTYCPGSAWAFVFLTNAWEICTGQKISNSQTV